MLMLRDSLWTTACVSVYDTAPRGDVLLGSCSAILSVFTRCASVPRYTTTSLVSYALDPSTYKLKGSEWEVSLLLLVHLL
jgi:hypothetical protein